MHSPWASMRACRNTPSAHAYTYRCADRSRFCQRSYSPCRAPPSVCRAPPEKDSAHRCPQVLPAPPGSPSKMPRGWRTGRSASKLLVRRRPQRQDCRRDANPFVVAGRSTIPNLHGPDSRLVRPCRAVTVPHHTVPTVGKLQVLHRGEKRLGLTLDGLRKKPPYTRSQDIHQLIVDLVAMTKRGNVASLFHGASLSLRGSRRLRHPPRYAAYLIPSSPSFPIAPASPLEIVGKR